ncbi:hypothetical protein A2U01_0102154, partial [Trifolium medium]|nr:hypothetical protein [Trifolium medium]
MLKNLLRQLLNLPCELKDAANSGFTVIGASRGCYGARRHLLEVWTCASVLGAQRCLAGAWRER